MTRPEHSGRCAADEIDRRARELALIRDRYGRHVMHGVAAGMTIEQAQRRSPLFRPAVLAAPGGER